MSFSVDNKGHLYLNEEFVLRALRLHISQSTIAVRERLLKRLKQCLSRSCIDEVSRQLDNQSARYATLQELAAKHDQTLQRQLLLCNDLYIQNDIAFCKKAARKDFLHRMREHLKAPSV